MRGCVSTGRAPPGTASNAAAAAPATVSQSAAGLAAFTVSIAAPVTLTDAMATTTITITATTTVAASAVAVSSAAAPPDRGQCDRRRAGRALDLFRVQVPFWGRACSTILHRYSKLHP